ncbi:hypothetical protein D3C86_1602980 [compost metagenome]
MPDKRWKVVARSLILAGKPDAPVIAEIHMAGGKLPQTIRHCVFLNQLTGRRIEKHKRGLHIVDIELGSSEIRMGLDAAIGDHHQPPVITHGHVMRADAMRVIFADAGKAVAGVIEPDDATIAVEVVFAGIKDCAIG